MPREPEREYRCRVCGRVDTYLMPKMTMIKPVHCGEPMTPGEVRAPDAKADIEIDVVADKGEPWRLDPDSAMRRRKILIEHPTWQNLHQVWRRGEGRLLGSEFVGMVGCKGGVWQYDSGPGVPSEKRTGSATSREQAVGAMVVALG